MGRSDSDFRFMAASDLLRELKKDAFKLDASQQKQVGEAILKLLVHELSGEVQTQAQYCLGPFVKKCSPAEISRLMESLLESLFSADKANERDSASYALKTIIVEMPTSAGPLIVSVLLPRLTRELSATERSYEVKVEILEVLTTAITHYGNLFTSPPVYKPLQDAVMTELRSRRRNNRKRAAQCLASLSVCMENEDFKSLIKSLVHMAGAANTSPDIVRSAILTIGSISRSAGFRLADSMELVVPLIIRCARGDEEARDDDDEPEEPENDELRENCFQTLESLVMRCPTTIAPYLNDVQALCEDYIKYDPNYNEDVLEDDDMDMEDGLEDFEEWQDDEEDIDYSDDEDVSWKVRKAASKTLAELVRSRSDLTLPLTQKLIPLLVRRFTEREETVKLDIFNTFSILLQQIRQDSRLGLVGPQESLESQIPAIMEQMKKLLSDKKDLKSKVRIAVFRLLRELVSTTHGNAGEHVHDLVPFVQSALNDKGVSSNLKIETLSFLRLLFALTQQRLSAKTISSLAPSLFACVGDSYYKITAEALSGCCALVPLLPSMELQPLVPAMYDELLPKLKAQDIDQEVKEEAIRCAALLISTVGDRLSDLEESYQILQDRLTNETTRLTTVSALEQIAASPLKLDLSVILVPSVEHLTGFLKLNNRQLKQNVLNTLNVFFMHQNAELLGNVIRPVLENAAPLVSEEDLHLSHLVLKLATTITSRFPDSTKSIKELLFPRVLALLESKILQGHALVNTLELLKVILSTRTTGFGFTYMSKAINTLLSKESLSKKCYPACAQCIGVLCASASEKKRASVVTNYMEEVRQATEEKQLIIALRCLGEIGRRLDLTVHQSDVEQLIFKTFDHSSEEVKSAAAFALGSVAIGNLQTLLPFLLKEIAAREDKQYLLLLSMREIISRLVESPEEIQQLVQLIQQSEGSPDVLFRYCQSPKEGVRNVVSECVGRLMSVNTADMLDKVCGKLASESPYERSTACASLKFTGVESSPQVQAQLQPRIAQFFDLLQDTDVDVRRSALLTFNFLAHNRPAIVYGELDKYLPLVYKETEENSTLLRKVKVGPFTHVVDDGLENRKAAFECMYTVMETCLSQLDLKAFIDHLVRGLDDNSADIKSMCHIMLEHLAKRAQPAVVQALDAIVEPLRTTLQKKPKESAVKQDRERYEELVRSTLRAILAISRIPDADSNAKFTEFLTSTVQGPDFAEKFQALKESQPTADLMDLS